MSEIKAIHKGLKDACLHIGGVFHVEQYRDGELVDAWDSKNIVTDEGLNHTLNVVFNGATQVATWYLGVFLNNYTPVAADTAATFPASSGEATTQYSEGARPTFVEATSTAKSITNSANKATFTFTADCTVYGAMLASVATKGATSGTLMCASKFSTSRDIKSGDTLLVTYTINGASA